MPQASCFKEYFSASDPGVDVKYLQSDASVTSDTGGTTIDTYPVSDLEDRFPAAVEKIMSWIKFRNIPGNANPNQNILVLVGAQWAAEQNKLL